MLLGVAVAGFYPSFFSQLVQAKWQHLFHGFAATAWELHARWMASTALPLRPPALARVIGGYLMSKPSFELAFHLSFAITHLLVIALLVHDWRGGRIRAPYLVLLAVLALQQVSFDLSLGVPLWRTFVDVIVRSGQ